MLELRAGMNAMSVQRILLKYCNGIRSGIHELNFEKMAAVGCKGSGSDAE